MDPNPPKAPDIRVKNTPVFKLKDKPRRKFVAINLQHEFGFIPETIIIEKIHGMSNTFVVRAILTPEEMKKDDERKKKAEKQLKVKTKKNEKTSKPGADKKA